MNRKQRRANRYNSITFKGYNKRHTKGASGALPVHLEHFRKLEYIKKATEFAKNELNKNTEPVVLEQVNEKTEEKTA